MNTIRQAATPAFAHEQASDEDLFSAFTRLAGALLDDMAMDERSRHIAGAQDHDDLVRRERDCAEFERRCATLPVLH